MQYLTTCAVLIKGDRVVKGTIVELDPEEAKRYGSDLEPVKEVAKVQEPEPTPEKPLDEMTADELRAKAGELGLSKSGSKADLIERITLHGEELQDNQK
jgi:hypothetical protein